MGCISALYFWCSWYRLQIKERVFLTCDISFFFIGYFIYSHYNVISFPSLPSTNSLFHPHFPASMRVLTHSPTHSHLTLAFPYTGASIEPPWDQGPLLPLMPDKAIPCYICNWSHVSLHVYSLVGGLVPGGSGVSGWLILWFFLWGRKPLQLLQSFS
jgi:hypothetical protein